MCRSRCAIPVAGRLTGLAGNLPHSRRELTAVAAGWIAVRIGGVTELDPTLYDLAEAFGVATEYWDWQGRHISVARRHRGRRSGRSGH